MIFNLGGRRCVVYYATSAVLLQEKEPGAHLIGDWLGLSCSLTF